MTLQTANPITSGTQHWPLLSCWLGEMHWTASWRWREYWCMLLGWSWAGTVPALVTGDGSGQRPKKLYYIQTTTLALLDNPFMSPILTQFHSTPR